MKPDAPIYASTSQIAGITGRSKSTQLLYSFSTETANAFLFHGAGRGHLSQKN
jgi:hypothetical protein